MAAKISIFTGSLIERTRTCQSSKSDLLKARGTDPEQKRQLIERLTEDFIEICGEVTRPFVYCVIQETPALQWGISGVPMPDLAYLTGERREEELRRANQLMGEMQAQQEAQPAQGAGGQPGR